MDAFTGDFSKGRRVMLHRFFWSWLRRWFFRKPGSASNDQRPTRQPRRLGGVWVVEDWGAFLRQPWRSTQRPSSPPAIKHCSAATPTPPAWRIGLPNSTPAPLPPRSPPASSTSTEVRTAMKCKASISPCCSRATPGSSRSSLLGRALTARRRSWEQIEARLCISDEYVQKSGSTLNSWVTQMFQDVLHRPLANGELSYFQQLSSPNVSRQATRLANRHQRCRSR